MPSLKKCPTCSKYTFKETCPKCSDTTTSAHYTFSKIKNAPKDSAKHFEKKRNQIPKQERVRIKQALYGKKD